MVICLEQGASLHMAQLMPLPLTVSCFSKIQIGFTFLVPAHPGRPGQRAVKRVYILASKCCSGLVVTAPDCRVRRPRFESHRRRLCLLRWLMRYAALGMGCAPLLQCLGRLSRASLRGRYQLSAVVKARMSPVPRGR